MVLLSIASKIYGFCAHTTVCQPRIQIFCLLQRKVSMSRIGKLPIEIPAGVTITVDTDVIAVEGSKGKLIVPHLSDITVSVDGAVAIVTRKNDGRIAKSQHGLQRSLLKNAVDGVTKGFEKKLEVNGVGFRVAMSGSDLEMSLGFSHPVKYKAPTGVQISTNKMEITVAGIDKQQVGQVAAEIRALKKPEPYKGKGIKYVDEQILRKAGKTGK
jgi:large subunit ribosomal protein L6